MSRNLGFLVGLLSIVLLSANATVAILARNSLSFLALSTLGSLVAFATLTLIHSGTIGVLATKLFRDPWVWAAIMLKFINDLAFYFAVMESAQIEATVIVYLYPLFNIVLGSVILNKRYARLNVKEWILVVTGFVSVALLTPLSSYTSLTMSIFLISLLSAAASVYVVIVQKVADTHELNQSEERGLVSILFGGSFLFHLLFLVGLIASGSSRMSLDLHFFGDPLVAVLAIIWVGIVSNILVEVLWLRAVRVFDSISLKSLFFLSPVLGACYMAFLGIDRIDAVVFFSLTGVVVSNYLIHQDKIDDLPFVVFIFGLFFATTILTLLIERGGLDRFALTDSIFNLQISFVTIFGGFLLFRAMDVYQRASRTFMGLLEAVAISARDHKSPLDGLDNAMVRLARLPDISVWQAQTAAEGTLRKLLMLDPNKSIYFRFLEIRTVGVTFSENFLMILICAMAIPTVLAKSLEAGSGYFAAAFAAAVFAFLPALSVELSSFRMARPYVSFMMRRALFLAYSTSGDVAEAPLPIVRKYQRGSVLRILVLLGLTLVCAAASWALLETARQIGVAP